MERLVVIGHQGLGALEAALAGQFELAAAWKPEDRGRVVLARVLVVAGDARLDTALVEAMTGLELIVCVSAGYDGIDVDWVRQRGLRLTVAQGVNDQDTAEHAISRILACRHSLVEADRLVRQGEWRRASRLSNRSVVGARLGIVGFGRIGQAVAERAVGLRMEVSWWGPTAKDTTWRRAASLPALAGESEILVVAARSHDGNAGLISADIIAALGPEGLLINVARGRLVDEAALIAALRSGALGGAALDVFETEPTDPARWADVPNVLLTPHMAGKTREALGRIVAQLRGNLEAFFAGEALLTPL